MNEITRLYNKLESEYPDGGYVSRSTIFSYVLDDGKISKETYREAKEYYGRLWNYTGD